MSDGRSRHSQSWDDLFESETGLEEESMGSWKSSPRYPAGRSSRGAGGAGRSRSDLLEPSATEVRRQTTTTRRHPARDLEQEEDDWYDHQQDRHDVPRANRSGLQVGGGLQILITTAFPATGGVDQSTDREMS